MAHLELFILEVGPYPRRVLIYLAEKGLLNSPYIHLTPVPFGPADQMNVPGKPPGTVPILKLPDGSFIRQSLAIINFFEDICENPQEDWHRDIASQAVNKSLRGDTPTGRALILESLALADEVSTLLGFTWHKGSKLFTAFEPTSEEASRLCFAYAQRTLETLDRHYINAEQRFEQSNVDVTDCVLFSILQFAKEFYDFDVPKLGGFTNLEVFYEVFKQRDSAKIGDDFYPAEAKAMASQWLADINHTQVKAV